MQNTELAALQGRSFYPQSRSRMSRWKFHPSLMCFYCALKDKSSSARVSFWPAQHKTPLPRTCTDFVGLMHVLRAAFQNKPSGQTLCRTWADLKAKLLLCFFILFFWMDAAKTAVCLTAKRPAYRCQCHHPHFSTTTTVDTSLGIAQGELPSSPHRIIPSQCRHLFWFVCPFCCRMPPGSGLSLFLHHFLPISHGLLSQPVRPLFLWPDPSSNLSCSYLYLEVKTHRGWYTSFIAPHTCLGLLLGWENRVVLRNNYCTQKRWTLTLPPNNAAFFSKSYCLSALIPQGV